MRKVSIAVGAIAILLCSLGVLVITPHFATLRQTPADFRDTESSQSQNVAEGREVYVDLGCVYCHSQQPRHPKFGPDNLRGWGKQPSAVDYSGQFPHQLGTMRTGPDLFNIGARNPSVQWNLIHLYNPRWVVPWSIMPAYPFLFEEKSPNELLDQDAVVLDLKNIGITSDRILVANQRALDLVSYLVSLKGAVQE